MAPQEAILPENRTKVYNNLYGFRSTRHMLKSMLKRKPKLSIGKYVRVPQQKDIFAKGYRQNFTDRIYTLVAVNGLHKNPLYKLKSYEGERIPGRFYAEEAVPVKENDIYRVEILGEKGRGKRKQYRVRFHNYPGEEPVWINASDLQSLS